MVAVRSLAQWVLDYAADGHDQGFPFALPYLDLYVRCLHAAWAVDAFLDPPPAEAKLVRALQRLDRILRPLAADALLDQTAQTLRERAEIFRQLRAAPRLTEKETGGPAANDPRPHRQTLRDIRQAVDDLADSLRQRRSQRGPTHEARQASDIVLAHLERHGDFLWGHAMALSAAASV